MIFFEHIKSELNDKLIQFTAFENEINEGECLLDLRYDDAEVTYVTCNPSTPHVTEGLIRAAFNYAANKGFYIGKCKCDNACNVLQRMNFEFVDGEYTNDIPSILMGKCCCEN